MIKILLGFAILFGAFYTGIPTFRHMTGKERWDLTKTVVFSIICSVLALATMMLFVFLF